MATPRITSEDVDVEETVVGPAISIRGRIEGEEDLRVEGRVEGSIILTETLYVEPSGIVIAQVDARDVVVSGIVIGDVTAGNCITLNKGAKLVGNIRSPRLIIADGASFRGDVAMGGEDATAPVSSRTRATATVPRGAIGGSSTSARSRPRSATVSGSYETRRSTSTATTAPVARREVVTPARAPAPAARTAPPRVAPRRAGVDDDVTVVIKHTALNKGEAPSDDDEPTRKRAKKSARMPARGRRKAGRRGES